MTEVLNMLIAPNYYRVNLDAGEYITQENMRGKKVRSNKAILVTVNGVESSFSSAYAATESLGLSSSLIKKWIDTGHEVVRKNGDIVTFKRI